MRGTTSELSEQNKETLGLRKDALRLYGVYLGRVADVRDPENIGRVRVTIPPSVELVRGLDAWARMATLFAGHARGTWFIPDVGDEVLIAFEAGDLGRPYVLGSLWNTGDRPPASMDAAGANEKKVIRTRRGVQVTLVDQENHEHIVLETPGGQRITLRDGPGSIEFEDSNGNAIKLEASGITIDTSAKVRIRASQVEISTSIFTVDAGMAKFSGVVQADTILTNSVVSASYSPGAGNVW
jgi:uncharacterized protein involved in type VI secretion and phage assembly